MLFYLPDFQNPILPESESKHVVQVLRMQAGDSLEVTDGKGHFAVARLQSAHPRSALVHLENIQFAERLWKGQVFLAMGPTKNLDRMEWLVEKATELGINGFYFIKTARTERQHLNLERLEKIALAAMKQSGQHWLPEIFWITRWKDFPFQRVEYHWFGDLSFGQKSVFQPGAEASHMFWIGPEGDFTQDEWQQLKSIGAKGISLSPHILRTETAALTAISLYHFLANQ